MNQMTGPPQVPQPRMNMSAYACFTKHFCNQMQLTGGQQGVLTSDLSKMASERWKGMMDDEKKPYKELSIQEKARHQLEKAQIPGTVIASTATGRKRKLAASRTKDPSFPKRATTAFFFFAQMARPKVRAEHPEYKVTEVSKELGKLWGAMKPEEKEKYDQMAAQDRERYVNDLKKYYGNANQQGQDPESEDEA